MSRLAPLEVSFFAMESTSRPMHAGGVMVFDPPADGDRHAFVEEVMASFRSAPPVAPWNQRPVFGIGSLPHWETVDDVELEYHVRRLTVPAPGSFEQLMELVSYVYSALLDRSRPLWEAYVIDGIEGHRTAVFVKAHHALADGIGGLRMFYGSLSSGPDAEPRPVWSALRTASGKPRSSGSGKRIGHLARAPLALARLVPDTVRLAREGTAPPFLAARLPTMAARISSARSFAAFDLPLDEVQRIGRAFDGTVNDVVLSVCDDAMHRYVSEAGGATAQRMVALMPISTRREGDDSSNAAGASLVALGDPAATPGERLLQVAASTRRIKAGIRRASPLAFQLQTLSMLGVMELRERLPVGRSWIPNVANFTLSNVPGAPPDALYLGHARLAGLYAAPVVSGSNAANITLIPYLGTLCIGIGAARNLIPDTGRLAACATASFEDLRSCVPKAVTQ